MPITLKSIAETDPLVSVGEHGERTSLSIDDSLPPEQLRKVAGAMSHENSLEEIHIRNCDLPRDLLLAIDKASPSVIVLTECSGLSRLRPWKSLELKALRLVGTSGLSKDVMRMIARPGLNSIVLTGSDVDDGGIAELARARQTLTRLDLTGTVVTGDSFGAFGTNNVITSLNVSRTKIEDGELLNGFLKLESLDLGYTRLDDRDLRNLNFPNLCVLSLRQLPLTDPYEFLSRHKMLTHINLTDTNVESKNIQLLKELPCLRKLFMSGTHIDEKSIDTLASLPLTTLYVGQTKISDQGRKQLSQKLGIPVE